MNPRDAVDFLDMVVPRMRALGVSDFTFAGLVVKLGEDPAQIKAPAPAQRPRLTAVDLAMSGPPVEPQYATDAKSPSK